MVIQDGVTTRYSWGRTSRSKSVPGWAAKIIRKHRITPEFAQSIVAGYISVKQEVDGGDCHGMGMHRDAFNIALASSMLLGERINLR